MGKVYCRGCLAEVPDYAHFCPLCGTRRTDQAESPSSCDGGTLAPASQDFDAGLAPVSAGRILVTPSTVIVKKDDDVLPLLRQARTARRAVYQQPQALQSGQQSSRHIAHKQAVSSPRASLAEQMGTRAVRYSVIGICVVLLVALVVLLASSFVRMNAQNAQVATPPSPVLITMNATSVFPGGSITLHGANFTPGATVTFSSDGTDLALAAVQPSTALVIQASLAYSVASAHRDKAYGGATVQYDGTFDIALSVPQSWQVNSVHKLQAKELSSGKGAFVDVKVLSQRYTNSNAVPKVSLPGII